MQTTQHTTTPVKGLLLAVLTTPFLLGHGDGGCGGEDKIAFGPPTETSCPPEGTDLSYDNFAKPFMEAYCLRCHSERVEGPDREGAPGDHNFDTRFELVAFTDHIDWMAGSGPNATNEQMPPDGTAPSLQERQDLSLWLSCASVDEDS